MRKLPCTILALVLVVIASPRGWAQPFPMSEGLYRLPYATGTGLRISGDVWTHNPAGCIDLVGREEADRGIYWVTAMAGGWIRAIRDFNDRECHASLPAPNNFCCNEFNNFIVLEHPNGEWSTYIHLAQNSIRGRQWGIGRWVNAGDTLGREGSVGCSSGPHTHIEVARPFGNITQPWDEVDGVLRRTGQLVNPVFCGVPGNVAIRGQEVTCGPCQDICIPIVNHAGAVIAPATVRRASVQITTTASFGPSVSAIYRAGTEVVFSPGFTVLAGSSLSAHIKGCNTQN
jgi:hypothetical protein